MSLHGKKRLGKKDRKGWHYDKILVHFKEFGPKYHLFGTNLNEDYGIIQFKIIHVTMVIFHMCINIFVYNHKHKNPKKSKTKFQWTTKHVFWEDYFLHMWFTPKAKHFEPIEHNLFSKWLKKNPFPCNLFFQNFKSMKVLYDLVIHQIHPMNMYFHKRGHVSIV